MEQSQVLSTDVKLVIVFISLSYTNIWKTRLWLGIPTDLFAQYGVRTRIGMGPVNRQSVCIEPAEIESDADESTCS